MNGNGEVVWWAIALMTVSGVITHWLKHIVMMRKDNPTGYGWISVREYWIGHWPETLIAFTSASAGVAALYEFDYLTLATAWGAGFLGDSTADLLGGRVQAIINAGNRKPPPGED